MNRVRQTLTRLGAGLTAFGSLIWLFWPENFLESLDPEPLFVFLVSAVVWVFTEFKFNDDIENARASPNDVRNARDLLRLHAEEFRTLLKHHDTFQFLDVAYYNLVSQLLRRSQNGSFIFQNKELENKFRSFCTALERFDQFVGSHTAPELIAGALRTGFKPYQRVSQEQYNQCLNLAREANDLASEAWDKLTLFCEAVKELAPEAFDEPLSEVSWRSVSS